jgi:hypothetical protein
MCCVPPVTSDLSWESENSDTDCRSNAAESTPLLWSHGSASTGTRFTEQYTNDDHRGKIQSHRHPTWLFLLHFADNGIPSRMEQDASMTPILQYHFMRYRPISFLEDTSQKAPVKEFAQRYFVW